ncbi:hypothetical protein [Chlorogloeopsis fritschii]|nr:hypothetical protein [Chlorogloeopsis fritschii]
MAGKDLGSRLRITTPNQAIKTILSRHYGQPDANSDFLAEKINIYLAYDEVDRTFPTAMKAHEHSGFLLECDRHTIYRKCVPTKDEHGNVWRPIREVNEPCPMRDKDFMGQCPNGCQKQGELLFYLKEVLDADMMVPARLTTHSYEDLTYVTSKLEEISNLTGGKLTSSPFPCYQYHHHIPMILTRTEVKTKRPQLENGMRTGKKADHKVWALSLDFDPNWVALYRQWQMLQEMTLRGLKPPQSAIAGLLRGEVGTIIDVESNTVEPLSLPSSEDKSEQVWKSFLDALSRCDTKDKIHQLHSWAQKPKQWQYLKHHEEEIKTCIESAIAELEF